MINRIIDTLEKRLGVSVDYLREIAAASRAALLKFMLFMPLAGHKSGVDAASWHVAALTATLHQDCGTCAQIAVNEALRNGVPAEYLAAVLEDDAERLPPYLRDVHGFTLAVVERRDDTPQWRDRLRERIGNEGIVTLSMTIASAHVFPLVKRGLGHDVSCRLVQFDLGAPGDGSSGRVPQARVPA